MDIITTMQTPTLRASFALDIDRSVFVAEVASVSAAGMRHARSAAVAHRARNRACIGDMTTGGFAVRGGAALGTDAPSTAYAFVTGQPVDGKGTRLGSSSWSPPV